MRHADEGTQNGRKQRRAPWFVLPIVSVAVMVLLASLTVARDVPFWLNLLELVVFAPVFALVNFLPAVENVPGYPLGVVFLLYLAYAFVLYIASAGGRNRVYVALALIWLIHVACVLAVCFVV